MPAPEPPEAAALRAALNASPDNVPLRLLVGDALLKYNLFAAATTEYREALRRAPRSALAKLGLARAFLGEGKRAEGLVVLEDLLAAPDAPAAAHLLLARQLCETGELQKSARSFQRARELDPAAHDPDLAARLEPFLQPPAEEPPPTRAAPEAAAFTDDVDSYGRIAQRAEDGPGEYLAEVERPNVAFADVGGMDAVKEQIRMKIIHPLAHAGLFKAYGKKIGGGLLLYGPPGCGKTHLARATAGEVRAGFLSLGLHDVLDMWLGSSEKRLHEIFEQARRSRPTVLFVDEVDALAASRADLRHSAGRNLINQFLAEMDGLDADNEGLLILAATNAPWHLDSAFRRPGRFDQIVFVPPPDEPARAAILRVMLQGKPAAELDFAALARKTEGFSGADLKGLVDRAIEAKLAAAMKSGAIEPLSTKDFLGVLRQSKPSTLDWFATAKNYALYANQGGHYDEILAHLKIKR